jgi:hypothetical protein
MSRLLDFHAVMAQSAHSMAREERLKILATVRDDITIIESVFSTIASQGNYSKAEVDGVRSRIERLKNAVKA